MEALIKKYMFKLFFQIIKKEKAFTISELLVALGIFAFVVTLASAIFVKSIKNERRLITLMTMTNNLDSAIELMAREARTGFLFEDPKVDYGTSYIETSTLVFKGGDGEDIKYELSSFQILRNGKAITSPDIKVDYLKFGILKEKKCSPWRITIFMGVSPKQNDVFIKPFYIQTTVSSRIWPKDMPFIYKGEKYEDCK